MHVYNLGVWESARQGQGAQLLVRHPFLNGSSAKKLWVPTTANHNSYKWGLFYTGLELG